MQRFLDAVPDGARALLIEGEAGVGKTALWQAALARAQAAGMRWRSPRARRRPRRASPTRRSATSSARIPRRWRTLPRAAAARARGGAPAGRAHGEAPGPAGRRARHARPRCARSRARRRSSSPSTTSSGSTAPTAAVLAFAARRLADEPRRPAARAADDRRRAGPAGPRPALAGDRLDRLALAPLSLGAVQRLLQRRLGWVPSAPGAPPRARAVGRQPVLRARARPRGAGRNAATSSPASGCR